MTIDMHCLMGDNAKELPYIHDTMSNNALCTLLFVVLTYTTTSASIVHKKEHNFITKGNI